MISDSAAYAGALRASSAACLAVVLAFSSAARMRVCTSVTRACASASLMPVSRAISCDRYWVSAGSRPSPCRLLTMMRFTSARISRRSPPGPPAIGRGGGVMPAGRGPAFGAAGGGGAAGSFIAPGAGGVPASGAPGAGRGARGQRMGHDGQLRRQHDGRRRQGHRGKRHAHGAGGGLRRVPWGPRPSTAGSACRFGAWPA
ncbi:hypothetical protein G6F24_015777 [Rhizopus arrhizus]|nr:hypothetical protein G6F24_015777 [Rhizopus arrhizus]